MHIQKIVGLIINIVLWNLFSLFLLGIDIPIPSSYITLMIMLNAIFAFFSIFMQRLVIVIYEVNVFEEPESISDYTYKYFAILSSGINYYIQIIFRRLPFVLNKLAALLFLLTLIFMWAFIAEIFT